MLDDVRAKGLSLADLEDGMAREAELRVVVSYEDGEKSSALGDLRFSEVR